MIANALEHMHIANARDRKNAENLLLINILAFMQVYERLFRLNPVYQNTDKKDMDEKHNIENDELLKIENILLKQEL